MKFKFQSAPRVPKHLRPQCQGTEQCSQVWNAPEAIELPECFWYGDRSKMLWCGESCGCHRPLDPAQFLQSSNSVFARTACPQVWRFMNPAGKQKVVVCQLRFLDPCCNGIRCWRCNFKLNRSRGFLLHDDRSGRNAITVANVPYPQAH